MSPDQANGFYSRTFQLGIGKLHLKVPRVRTALDFDGHKPVLGYWVNEGGENRGFWSDVFQDLISRGLKRVLMFVTDDFSVVKELIEKLYPLADHQLCYVHMQRSLMRNLSERTYAEIKRRYTLPGRARPLMKG